MMSDRGAEVEPGGESRQARAAAQSRRRLRSPQDVRDRRRRLALIGLTCALGALLVNALVGENGYLSTLRARKEEMALLASLRSIRLENRRLQQESRSLQHDPSALEDAARRQLGLLRPGETLVIVHDKASGAIPRVR